MSTASDEQKLQTAVTCSLEQTQNLHVKIDDLIKTVGPLNNKLDNIASMLLTTMASGNSKRIRKRAVSSTEAESDDDCDSMLDNIDSSGGCISDHVYFGNFVHSYGTFFSHHRGLVEAEPTAQEFRGSRKAQMSVIHTLMDDDVLLPCFVDKRQKCENGNETSKDGSESSELYRDGSTEDGFIVSDSESVIQ